MKPPVLPSEWQGDHPYFLMFVYDGGEEIEVVDLDRDQWMVDQGWIFRKAGELHLVRKADNVVVLSVNTTEGEQSYYVGRHVGIAGGVNPSHNEVVAFGIGKKRVNGNQDNLWVLPWGQICGGNDVEFFALKGLKQGRQRV